ncbi:fatty acid desaturase-domain-containing protein [Blastocladiella britannica]|nr:fatty acid desaturase-domain-containing protein [Blastocladiella britannica]
MAASPSSSIAHRSTNGSTTRRRDSAGPDDTHVADKDPRRRNANKAGFAPIDVPIKELRDLIPAHYFERSAFWSSLWLLHDLVIAGTLFYGALHIDAIATVLPAGTSPAVVEAARWALWAAYWVAQGVACTGIWVLAHECGHQAYSASKAVNNSVGYVLHSLLLVPYHSWRITHSTHHKSTNHLERDQVFVPPTLEETLAGNGAAKKRFTSSEYHHGHESLLQESPLMSLVGVIVMLTFGWPAYIIKNVSGQEYPAYGWASHFFPTSPFFEKRDYADIVLSDIGVFATLGALGYASSVFGLAAIVKFYVIPYLFVNMWLVLITYLQHTHEDLPHYTPAAFTFLRGAVATVDRDYGILNYFFHNIADSHVVHHLFSNMPHYYAIKATPIIREALTKAGHYHQDTTPIATALWNTWRACKYVEPVDNRDVLWYNN